MLFNGLFGATYRNLGCSCFHYSQLFRMVFYSIYNYAYEHSKTYSVIVFSEVEHKSNYVKVRIDYIHGQLYTYLQGSLVEIHTPAQWNWTDSSRTASPPFLSPSSTLLPYFCQWTFIPARNNLALISKMLFQFLYFLQNYIELKCVSQGMYVFARLYSAAPDVYAANFTTWPSDI